MTVNEYIPGQGIRLHTDTHSAFEGEWALPTSRRVLLICSPHGPVLGPLFLMASLPPFPPFLAHTRACAEPIASLSLASDVAFELRAPGGAHKPVLAAARSLIVLTGAARYLWAHTVALR